MARFDSLRTGLTLRDQSYVVISAPSVAKFVDVLSRAFERGQSVSNGRSFAGDG